MKNKETGRKHHRTEETKEAWLQNAIRYPGLNPRIETRQKNLVKSK